MEVNATSRTQRIIVDPASYAVSIIYAGHPGPRGPAGPEGPPGPPGGTVLSGFWEYESGTGQPGPGGIRTSPGLTTVYMSETDDYGINRSAELNEMNPGDSILIRDDTGNQFQGTISTATDRGTYREFAVIDIISTGTPPATGSVVSINGIEAPTPGPPGEVIDEVWISPDQPTDPDIELWYDVDAVNPPILVGVVSYRHVQGSPAATWTVVHNLGWYPNVIVEDSSGSTVEGETVWNDDKTVTLTFSAAFSGVAYCS